jgi:hypothetical protein
VVRVGKYWYVGDLHTTFGIIHICIHYIHSAYTRRVSAMLAIFATQAFKSLISYAILFVTLKIAAIINQATMRRIYGKKHHLGI